MINTKERAFTLVEVILIAIFVGIFAVIAIPRINIGVVVKKKVDIVTRKLVIDFRRTQMMAINNAVSNNCGYGLRMTGSSPYTGYQIINLSNLSVIDTHIIDESVTCTGGKNFDFGPLGNLINGSATQVNISSQGRSFTINIIPATGAVTCSGH